MMSRNITVVLMYHSHELVDLINTAHIHILYVSRTTNGSTVYSIKKCMDLYSLLPTGTAAEARIYKIQQTY
jgi:hypothetical protein